VASAKSVKTILVISQYFWPESFRVNELVLELKNRGYVVEILTSTPNYPSGKVFPDYASNPSKYRDYLGIKVHRVPQISRYGNKISLALNYFSFVISACIYSLLKLRNRNFDLIFGIQLSPIFSMIPAILCKKIIGAPLHLWVLDIWPDSIIGGGVKSNLIISPLKKVCTLIYSSADILFLSSNGFEAKFNQMGVTLPKLVYFPQWIEADYLGQVPLGSSEDAEVRQLISRWKDKVIFTFTGNIGTAQDFPSVLEGLKKCSHLKDLVVLVIGDGRYKSELIQRIQAVGLESTVFYMGQYPTRYMALFYYYSAYLIVPLRDTPVFSYTLPGKVQSYMSSGKPIIGMINGETRRVIDEVGCGYTVAAGDHNGFATMVDRCCSLDSSERLKLGRMGQQYAYENFRLESLADKLIRYF
jgi:colanic acid biosynthesis glycosyl transferase WcaI